MCCLLKNFLFGVTLCRGQLFIRIPHNTPPIMRQNLDSNPFRPIAPEHLSDSNQRIAVDFVPIIIRWEKLRLLYNAVLISLTVLWSNFLKPQLMLDPFFIFHICLGGMITNLCFFTGPAIEGYGRYFGIWNLGFSLALFVVGLLFTCLLTTAFLIVRAQ